MRSPEHRQLSPRAAKNYEVELSLRYLTPGAFRVLPPDDEVPPDPPRAPSPYRLTPASVRQKNQSFAIIAEPNISGAESRSSSPSGRVSPFRGRGFNPAGSRFASPNPSPPPEDARLTPTNQSPRHTSKIPTLSRRGSATAFGEKVRHHNAPSPDRRKLHTQLSQSLNNLSAKKVSNKPPQSPRRTPSYSRGGAFTTLSPIVGSSPEPSQSQSSPSSTRIPKSRSQPASRLTSPTRTKSFLTGRPPPSSRGASRPISRNTSTSVSREPSPTKNPTSPTRIPVKSNYRNVQAKVNSFSKPKPKVPLNKPQVLSEQSDSDVPKPVNRSRLVRKESVNRPKLTRTNSLAKTDTVKPNNNSSSNTNTLKNNSTNKTNPTTNTAKNASKNKTNEPKKGNNTTSSKNIKNNPKNKNTDISDTNLETTVTESDTNFMDTTTSASEDEITKTNSSMKLSDLLQPSTTAVVSSTTTTVTQPLKIEAKIEHPVQFDKPKPISPMVDGRVLSATSVSHAMNKMNDTVLDTQTLIKDRGFSSKLSPAANAIISVANEKKNNPSSITPKPNTVNNPALDTKNATTALPTVDPVNNKPPDTITNNNHNHVVTHSGVISSRALEDEVQRNMSRLISPDHIMGNSVQKSVNDKMKEARTVVAADVKPIRITVKEKPGVEVQSGNVRLPVSATNGLERPSLPPSQQTPPNETADPQNQPKKNACTRFLSTCRDKLTCKQNNTTEKKDVEHEEEEQQKSGCFNCMKKKEVKNAEPPVKQVRINIEENEPQHKKKIWDRLKCCGKNKIGDTGCFPTGKRKSSWAERRDSILSDPVSQQGSKCSKACCGNVFRKMFCLNFCCKKKVVEEPVSRKASIVSKKKSLTPTAAPPEDTKPKLDISLVEHMSHMKAAIPVLPICLAWFCLVMNCIGPGTGTIFSGMFCLCFGKPRFSQKDGPRQRIGAFIIDLIIGVGQCFTVLFCLVGWGWSIWWGVIMVKLAKKYQKIKHIEAIEEAAARPAPIRIQNNHRSDPERGS